MKYHPIDPSLFIRNRRRLADALAPGAVAVFNANDVMPTSADGIRSFVQNTDLFYLCGIDQEETILLLCPRAEEEKHREILFVRETNPEIVTWQGRQLTQDEARALSGVQTVYWLSEFERVFRPLALAAERIYLNTNEHLRAEVTVETRDDRFIRWCRGAFPLHRYCRLAPIMQDLRVVKAPAEVDLIRRACQISEKAFRRLLGFIRPGVWEFEIEAELVHAFLSNRARRPAFAPIVASGADSCVLHYTQNDKQCRDGDLVLMDFGAEYANYASDLTRTVPVNGRFSPRQRAVYDAVLRIQRAAIDRLRPGKTLAVYQREVGVVAEKEMIALGLLDAREVAAQPADAPLYKKYFMHGTSHHLGLDVHDVGRPGRALEAGMVLTCEPGIYIREEGIGVRIENDILVTTGDPVDLTATVPITAEEIETLMAG